MSGNAYGAPPVVFAGPRRHRPHLLHARPHGRRKTGHLLPARSTARSLSAGHQCAACFSRPSSTRPERVDDGPPHATGKDHEARDSYRGVHNRPGQSRRPYPPIGAGQCQLSSNGRRGTLSVRPLGRATRIRSDGTGRPCTGRPIGRRVGRMNGWVSHFPPIRGRNRLWIEHIAEDCRSTPRLPRIRGRPAASQ